MDSYGSHLALRTTPRNRRYQKRYQKGVRKQVGVVGKGAGGGQTQPWTTTKHNTSGKKNSSWESFCPAAVPQCSLAVKQFGRVYQTCLRAWARTCGLVENVYVCAARVQARVPRDGMGCKATTRFFGS